MSEKSSSILRTFWFDVVWFVGLETEAGFNNVYVSLTGDVYLLIRFRG